VNSQPVAQQEQSQTIHIRGVDPSQMFSGRQLVELLSEAMKDGAKLRFE
jgi:hypothetical protein